MPRSSLCLLAVLCVGCASYGFADRPSSHTVDRPVAVRTLDVDADAGANVATLTREFVQQLRAAGISDVEWTGAERARDVIECRVSLSEDRGFGSQAFVEVTTVCTVDGDEASRQSADAQLALPSADRSLGRREAAEAAARASLAPTARQVATYLSQER